MLPDPKGRYVGLFTFNAGLVRCLWGNFGGPSNLMAVGLAQRSSGSTMTRSSPRATPSFRRKPGPCEPFGRRKTRMGTTGSAAGRLDLDLGGANGRSRRSGPTCIWRTSLARPGETGCPQGLSGDFCHLLTSKRCTHAFVVLSSGCEAQHGAHAAARWEVSSRGKMLEGA